ncbi:DUF2326 domain-containing protein [Aneurinibacillus sp. Ricciae_BoGa-3]|uniref:DUF2326 domain-containing protein n=1 Tax=Aneurinibacillus sp. Ricciae_BoGa-3 TaxID=3022697 RepID=UPI0023405D20|nr:DUF2326 domain-containing protein [Aneurinibacillus sp. Ricciae_BoGa-3]WCK55384.1 DUF2326 domain-containing protein [Aneurinibacillus sp. Ricciae_BoGa-3]
MGFPGGLEKSIQYLNDLLQFEVLRNRNYRKTLSYFLRDNQSYVDVFQLSKHIGKHINWKPLVIELLGFDTQSVIKKYEIDAEIQRLQEVRNELAKLNDAQAGEAERYRVFLDIKLEELQEKEEEYSRFDFSTSDIEKPKELVQEVDAEITKYINENYYLKKQIENATKSIFDYRIDLKELESFYKEIGLYFEKQLVKEYEDLVAFHYELTEERNEILSEIIEEASSKYNQNVLEISRFNLRRAELLQYLNATDAMEKYKVLQEEIIGLKADILNLQDKIKSLHETHDKDLQIQDLFTKRSQEVYNIRQEIYGKKNTLLTTIKHHFSSIINKSVGDIGIITLDINKNDNVDIKPEIVDQDTKSKGNKGDGTTYKKLMCAAFDLALLATYSPMKYFKFVYHDGIFDGLDNRQKNNFYRVIQKYVSKYNIQYIFTAIQDELPPEINSENTIEKLKEEGTIIRVLHDDGNEGRLFNMPPF